MDDIGRLARMLGGTVALQVNDQQVFYHSGKLLVHICYCAAVDGRGHSSEHYDIFESWRSTSGEPEHSGVESIGKPQQHCGFCNKSRGPTLKNIGRA